MSERDQSVKHNLPSLSKKQIDSCKPTRNCQVFITLQKMVLLLVLAYFSQVRINASHFKICKVNCNLSWEMQGSKIIRQQKLQSMVQAACYEKHKVNIERNNKTPLQECWNTCRFPRPTSNPRFWFQYPTCLITQTLCQ